MSDDAKRPFAKEHQATEGRGEAAKGGKSANLGVARDNAQIVAVADLCCGRHLAWPRAAKPIGHQAPFLTGTMQPPPPILAVPQKGP